MRKKLFQAAALLFVLISPLYIQASAPSHSFALSGFSGGMMAHAGWVGGGQLALHTPSGAALPLQYVYGVPVGLGGSLRVHLGKHLRVGGEGYGTNLNYGSAGSRLSIGWGGALADWQLHAGSFHPFAGLTIGGGRVRNVTFLKPLYNDLVTETDVSYRHYGFLAVAPFIGCEYELNGRMRLVLKADWLLNAGRWQPDFPSGPRIYFGFIFYHGYK